MNKTRWLVLVQAGLLGMVGGTTGLAQTAPQLTLKRAVALALQNSHELALARMRVNVASNVARFDHSSFLPSLYTGSGAVYTNGFPATPGGSPPSVFQLSYTQTLYNPPLRGQFRSAQEEAQGQRMALEGIRNDVILKTASDYLELLKVRGSLDWLRKERESAQKVLDVTRQRVAAGLELPIEVTKAELTQARIEQRLIGLEGRDEVLDEELRELTGLPSGPPLEVSPEELPPEPEANVGELVQMAMTNNPVIAQAEHERRARQASLRGERGGYWPAVELIGQYNVFNRVNNFDQFFRQFQTNNINVGVELTIPLFNPHTSAAVALARSRLSEAELDLGNRRAALAVEVRQEARKSRELDAGREVARLELKLAQETLAIYQAKLEQGRANVAEVEQARLEESEKWLGFLDADFQRQKGQLELLKTTGQLAQVFQ